MTTTQKAEVAETIQKDHLREIKIIVFLSLSIILYKLYNIFGEDETLHIYPLNAGKFTTMKNYAMFISYHIVFTIKIFTIHWVNKSFFKSGFIKKACKIMLAMVGISFLAYVLGGYILYKEILLLFNPEWMAEYENLFLAYEPRWPWRRWHFFMYLWIHLTDLTLTFWLYEVTRKQFSKVTAITCQGFIVFILLRMLDFVLYAGQVNIPFKVALITGWLVFVLFRHIAPKYLLED